MREGVPGQRGDKGVVDRSARVIAALCVLMAVLLPVATAAHLLRGWPNGLMAAAASAGVSLPSAPNGSWRLIAATVLALLPVGLASAALLHAGRCLAAFARGEHFSLAALRDLRGFAAMMLVAGIASAAVPTLIVLLLTTGGPGQSTLAISVGSQQLMLLLFAGVTWCIANVLAKALALAEEHALIV